MHVRPVSAALVRPLRSRVLRPGIPPEILVYPGDEHPEALHAAAWQGEASAAPLEASAEGIVAIATVYTEAPPEAQRAALPAEAFGEGAAFRLRGMASAPEVRGQGYGKAVLLACFAHARARGAGFLWCNARLGAVPFYEGLGLACTGPLFEIEGIGPHFVMWRALEGSEREG